jgi:hypothetical protein
VIEGLPAPTIDQPLAFGEPMPKLWLYTQGLIVLFVVIGMVIAIVRLSS